MPDLDDDARARLDNRLVRWLEGEEASALDLPTDTQGRVRVVVRFPQPIWDDDVRRLDELGLEVEDGDIIATGAFDRDDLLTLAHDGAVHSIGPVEKAYIPPPPSAPQPRKD